jgi:hypothetical protein
MFDGMFGGDLLNAHTLGAPIEFKGKQYMQIYCFGFLGEKPDRKKILLAIEQIDGISTLPAVPVIIADSVSW